MSDNKGVMIFGDVNQGKLTAITSELLGCGRRLADTLAQPLSVTLLGSDVSSLAQQAIALGADKVYVVDSPLLKDYQTDAYVAVMERLIKQVAPSIVLLGQTSSGSDLAPRLAFRLGTAATLDCVALEIEPASKQLQLTKPVYGGNAQAVFITEQEPKIASVRARVMPPAIPDTARKGEVITFDADLDLSTVRTAVIEQVKKEAAGIKLEEAPVVVSGGRGMGGAEGFAQLAGLAGLLKGSVGASRAASDNRWVSDTAQVGLTSKIVAPDIYIAVGISGASQHLAGCSGAKTIVAINKDPEANIFKVAHFGVIGDWKKVLPAFTAKVKELLSA